jgi:YbbR domain-containing protein
LLTADDIVVTADLTGLGPGRHTVELRTQVARQSFVADTQPKQITVTLEQSLDKLVPVTGIVTNEPPQGYQRGEPVFDVNQTLASGPASKVDQVVSAQVQLDLQQERNPFEDDVRLSPVDVDGHTVSGVTLDPAVVHVNLNIQQREDVREVRVTPNILVNTLPEGYVLTSISYDPQTVLVSGTPDRLANLPGTFFTAPIDLTGHTANFDVPVPVELPDPDLLIVSGQEITVSIGITTPTISKQFDAVPIDVLGEAGAQVHLAPSAVTVLLTGPQNLLETLTPADIRVTVDVSTLQAGNYQLTPTASIRNSELSSRNISLLPAVVDVQIVGPENSGPTGTETPTAEATSAPG